MSPEQVTIQGTAMESMWYRQEDHGRLYGTAANHHLAPISVWVLRIPRSRKSCGQIPLMRLHIQLLSPVSTIGKPPQHRLETASQTLGYFLPAAHTSSHGSPQ